MAYNLVQETLEFSDDMLVRGAHIVRVFFRKALRNAKLLGEEGKQVGVNDHIARLYALF